MGEEALLRFGQADTASGAHQGSLTGDWPGLRPAGGTFSSRPNQAVRTIEKVSHSHGWNFQISWGDPDGAWQLAVRYLASVITGLYGSVRSCSQWSQFAKRVLSPAYAQFPQQNVQHAHYIIVSCHVI